jgi:hypothetical protein
MSLHWRTLYLCSQTGGSDIQSTMINGDIMPHPWSWTCATIADDSLVIISVALNSGGLNSINNNKTGNPGQPDRIGW